MASNEYMLSHQDVVRAVIIQQNIHEGFWTLNINFNVTATHGANVPDPCLAVTIRSIGIMRTVPDDPRAIDAAALNPPLPARIEAAVSNKLAADNPVDKPITPTKPQSSGMQFCRDVYRNVAVQSPARASAKAL